ncbi:MAG: choice-of-anchor A family protein [Phycisphaeraceae bacterium]|nr:MAG: choice-of-anchor A family protein [Phycisphaeraceae bacterium]
MTLRNVLVFAAAAAGSSFAQADIALIKDWNLIVLGHWSNSSQDVEGNAFCGGNLSGGSPTIGVRLNAAQWAGREVLAVAGNTTVSNINLQAGNFVRGGSLVGNVNHNGGGSTLVDGSLGARAAAYAASLTTFSASLASLTANSAVQTPLGQPGPVRYNAAPGQDGLAVFSVHANDVFNNNLIQQIELNTNGASEIVINVAGSAVNFAFGNMVGEWTGAFARANVLWNFFEATSIALDRNFNGAILAPLAHLSNTTAIDGSVFVASFDQRGEVHVPFYGGNVPAPASLTLLGIAALGGARRRR